MNVTFLSLLSSVDRVSIDGLCDWQLKMQCVIVLLTFHDFANTLKKKYTQDKNRAA